MSRFATYVVALILSTITGSQATAEETIDLFNGKDLSGWTFHLADPQAKMGDVWSIKDGVLICGGKPAGVAAKAQDSLITSRSPRGV